MATGSCGPLQQWMGCVFRNPVKFQGLVAAPPHRSVFQPPLMMNVSCVVLCSEGHVAVQRYGCSVVPTSISQTLVLFNVSAAQRSLLMDPLIPPFPQETCEAHTSNCGKAVCSCVFVCVCVQYRLVRPSSHPGRHSHTGLETRTCCQATRTSVTPGAARYQHHALRRQD